MFDEFFDKCVLENEVQTSSEFTDKIKERLSKKLHTPKASKEDNLMKHINIAKTVISAAAVASLGALSMIGASADSVSTLAYTSADGKELGSVAYEVSSENGTLSEVGTVNIDDFNVKEVDDAVIRYVDADGNSAKKIGKVAEEVGELSDGEVNDKLIEKIDVQWEGKDSEVKRIAVTLSNPVTLSHDDLGNLIMGDKVIKLTRDDLEFGEAFDYTLSGEDGDTIRMILAKPKGIDNVALVLSADE